MKKVAFYTLGCKLNYAETSTIARQLQEHGMQKVDFHQAADVYVINTCSVTDHADRKCRKVVKEALRYSPGAFVAIVGCYAQLKPREIAEIPGVDAVLGAAEKFRLVELLAGFEKKTAPQVLASEVSEANTFHNAFSLGDRTRTFLKAQDGCDYSCSFCTIPQARGASRSGSVASVVEAARQIAESGEVKEIVLTGVNLGDFGIQPELGRVERFADLVKALDKVEKMPRFRISSIEPNLLTDEIIELVAKSDRFMPHFHVPLQSGSNAILKLMRRRYQRELYVERVAKIKELMPHACIGVDVIVGFPGETQAEFLETFHFLNELDISYLHVFPYSERDNTLAPTLPGRVLQRDRNDRTTQLRSLSEKKKRAFYEQHLNTSRPVLWEADIENGLMHGFTDNYIRVSTQHDPLMVNEIGITELQQLTAENVITGEPVMIFA
jgi:threonylcarbamoyladenosine tRNA methylthiotransferase MtaB